MSEPMEHIIKLKLIKPPEKITLNHTEYYWLIELLSDEIIKRSKSNDDSAYLEALLKKLIPYQIGNRQVELRLVSEEQA